jgi:uncharacterized membrane protein YhaH (DUF805 family)
MKEFILAYKRIFDFKGRATRKEYWMFQLISILFLFIALALLLGLEKAIGKNPIIYIIFAIFIIQFPIVNLSLTIRRLHDIGLSGWWWISPALIAYLFKASQKSDNKYGKYLGDIDSKNIVSNLDEYDYIDKPQVTLIKLKPTSPQYPIIKLTESQKITLGRDRSNDIVINNRYLSTSHIEIELIDDSIYITDMGSTNGTYIDGDKLEPYQPMELREGENLILGSEEVVYEL